MKKLIILAAVMFGCLLFKTSEAQISISAGVNIGDQPDWGPVGYGHAQYYYMPDIDAYYDVPAHQYVYLENGGWVHRATLPARYASWDRYHAYKVVLNERNPWDRDREYRTKYATYRGRHDQALIRDSHDARYRNHWVENRAIHNEMRRERVRSRVRAAHRRGDRNEAHRAKERRKERQREGGH